MYVHLVCGGCAVRGPRSVIGALTLEDTLTSIADDTVFYEEFNRTSSVKFNIKIQVNAFIIYLKTFEKYGMTNGFG